MKALPPPSRSSNVNPDRSTISANSPNPTSVPENSKDATSLRKTQHHTAGDRQADIQSPHQPSKSKSAGLFSLAAAAFDKTSSALANISEPVNTSCLPNPPTSQAYVVAALTKWKTSLARRRHHPRRPITRTGRCDSSRGAHPTTRHRPPPT